MSLPKPPEYLHHEPTQQEAQTPPCDTGSTATQLDGHQITALTDARNAALRHEAFKFALQESVRGLHKLGRIRDMLGFALAMWTLFVLWVIGNRASQLHDIAGIVATGLSLAVTTFAVWSFVAKWDEQVEKKNELAAKLNSFLMTYQKLYEADHPDVAKLRAWRLGLGDLDELRNHRLVTLDKRSKQAGHQHVAMKYINLDLKCDMCGKEWRPAFATALKSYSRFTKTCDNCGVKT